LLLLLHVVLCSTAIVIIGTESLYEIITETRQGESQIYILRNVVVIVMWC
jgi:hypothetical protein